MSKMKPAWLLERELKEAQARETYYKNRTRPQKTTVDTRNTTDFYYRSMVVETGGKGLLYTISRGEKVTAVLPIASVNLLADVPTGERSFRARGSGVRPAMVRAYKGDATPLPQKTAWGSRWIKYYANADGTAQTHISSPITGTGTLPIDSTARQAFTNLIQGSGALVGFCGKNGRAFYTPELTPASFNG